MSYPLSDVVMNAHVRLGESGEETHERDLQFFCTPPPARVHASLYFITVNTYAPRNADLTSFTTKKWSMGSTVPLQAWSGPEGSRKLRFPDFMTTAQEGGKVVSPTHRPHLPSGHLLVLISVRV